MSGSEMIRGRWQAHVGSQIYGEFYRLAIELTPPRVTKVYEPNPKQALIILGTNSGDRLATESMKNAAGAFLLSHLEELETFTDITTFIENRRAARDIAPALFEHTRDGIVFGHRVALGAANEVIQTSGIQLSDNEYATTAVAVLRNPSLDDVLEPLAITGFAVIGSHNAPTSVSGNGPDLSRPMRSLGIKSRITPIIFDHSVHDPAELETVELSLNPEVVAILREKLQFKNQHVRSGVNVGAGEKVYRNHLGKPGFSSGCPVAHGSGTFGLMREYLARTVELSAQEFGYYDK